MEKSAGHGLLASGPARWEASPVLGWAQTLFLFFS